MDVNQLRSFLELRKTRHFGKAGENLFVTQAAISSRIRQLEEELGVQLFTRNRNNIQLTPEGERFAPYAESLMLTWTRARQEVELPKEHTEQISIAATPGLCHYLLQKKLLIIRQIKPTLSIRIESQAVSELSRMEMDGLYDLVVLYEPPSTSDVRSVSLGKLKLSLLASYAAADAKSALKENYIYVDWGTSFEMFHGRKFGEVQAASLYTNMAYMAEQFLRDNRAAAYLPELICKQGGESQLIKVPKAPSFSRDVYAIYKTNTEKEALIKELLLLLQV